MQRLLSARSSILHVSVAVWAFAISLVCVDAGGADIHLIGGHGRAAHLAVAAHDAHHHSLLEATDPECRDGIAPVIAGDTGRWRLIVQLADLGYLGGGDRLFSRADWSADVLWIHAWSPPSGPILTRPLRI